MYPMDVETALDQEETWTALPNADEVAHVLAAEVRRLREELEAYRSTVTTGGPGVPFTPKWKPGDSSRPPTAPPEDQVVELPKLRNLTPELDPRDPRAHTTELPEGEAPSR